METLEESPVIRQNIEKRFLQSNGGATCGAALGRPSRRGLGQTKQVRSGHLTVQCRGEKALADMHLVMWRRCVMGGEADNKEAPETPP